MDKVKYEAIQSLLLNQAAVVSLVDLREFIAAIDRSETVTPILDPSLWMKGGRRVEKIKRLAQAYQQVQAAYAELREIIEAEKARSAS